jgi:arabinofuranan 3-O-arabinosyltransferase
MDAARGQVGILALLAYLPLLLTHRGMVAADTKPYLLLDPRGLLQDAGSMWQPDFAMGTVTHQNLGFLWPIGPFFAVGDLLGLADWIVQRLWLGSILFAAGMGVRWFLRTIGWRGAAVLVASMAYMLSPYVLDYIARISVILLPWAGLPWMLALTVRALRTPGWRHPALFALVTLTIGGVNATSLLLVGLGPVLWIAWSVAEGTVPWRRALGVAGRIGLLIVGTSIWWVVGLRTQAAYGLPTLRLTETYEVIADAATAPELFRGLGYWFFYGQDKLGPWIEPAHAYTRWALPLSFALPLFALLTAAVTRFRYRGHLLLLFGIGMLAAIAAHPFDAPSPLGQVFKAWTTTDAGLAMRSTPRALPLVVLATAVFLGAGAAALGRRLPRFRGPIAAILCLAILVNFAPLWRGQLLGDNLERPEELPAHWVALAAFLDDVPDPHESRVLEVPGSDFAAHRWGNTVDPILPGLMERGHVARELVPLGTPASAALVVALDTEIQEGRFDPDSLAPIARLMGVGDIVFRGDLQYERYRTPRPPDLWADLVAAPGLGAPVSFGSGPPNLPFSQRPLIDEHTLDRRSDAEVPPYVATFTVDGAPSILRSADPRRPIVIAGDAEGLVAVAGEGFLEAGRPVFYSASLVDSPEIANQPGALLLLTDTNRKRGQRWGTIRETQGYTERADEVPLAADPTDQRLAVLPDVPGSQTVAVQTGVRASATAYGNPVTFVPDSRPFNAVDGDPATAWKVGAFSDARGERLRLDYDEAIPVGGVDIQQVVSFGQIRHITDIRIRTAESEFEVTLDSRSFPPGSQSIELPHGMTDFLEIEILGTSDGERKWYFGARSVGFTEVGQSPVAATETVALPTDLMQILDGDAGQDVAVVVSRQRSDPLDPVRTDGELSLDRVFTLPFERAFVLDGAARLSTTAPSSLLDDLLGRDEGLRVSVTSHLSGSLRTDGHASIDGDLATAWVPAFGPQEGQVLTLEYPEPLAFGELQVLARRSDNHSLPVGISLFVDHAFVGTSLVTSVSEDLVAVHFAVETTASLLEFVVERTEVSLTSDWYSSHPVILPVAIVEVNGLPATPVTALLDDSCRDDLVQIDDLPVSVRILGGTERALARQPIDVELCGPPLELSAGAHHLTTTPGRDTGLDLDRLVLRSVSIAPPQAAGSLPTVRVIDWGKTSRDLVTSAVDSSFWLVLGESFTDGWRLTSEDVAVDAASVLIDGYANGWLIDPAGRGGDLTLHLEWTPQRLVRIGLVLSLFAAIACLLLAGRGRRDEGTDAATGAAAVRLVDPRGGLAVIGNRAAVGVGLAVAVGAWLNLPAWPLAAPLLGLVTGLVLAGRCWRRILPLLATGLMATAAFMIVLDQIRFRYPRDFIWPTFFDQYHVLGVLAVLCTLAEALRTLLARRSLRPAEATAPAQ